MWGKAMAGIVAASVLAACGGSTKAVTANTAGSSRKSPPAWQVGTPEPRVTAALIAQAGYGLTRANASPGTVDEVFGSIPADVRVNPSAKSLNDQYTRFGRCMAEQMKIHDLGHELALLAAYNRKSTTVQAAVETASSVCEGLAITPDANYKQPLKANP